MTLAADIAAAVEAVGGRGRSLVAFDGPDAAGKTTLADQVAAHLRLPAVRASIDGFHAPAAVRAKRGSLSPEGYYQDSFDHGRLADRLLAPFARGAAGMDVALYDHRTDGPRQLSVDGVPGDSVLLFDGVFLLRPQLRRWWTLSIYLHVSEAVTLARAAQRDAALFGPVEVIEQRYRRRYLPGQGLYRAEARPMDGAHIVVDNDHPAAPRIVKWSPPRNARATGRR